MKDVAATLTIVAVAVAALNVRDRRRARRQAYDIIEQVERAHADRLAADIAAARRRHPTWPAQQAMPADEWAVIERNADVIRLFRSELDHLPSLPPGPPSG
jgi:hypothetical protein